MLLAAEGFAPNAGPCAIWGTSRTTTAATAALVNGVLAHAQELDDFGGADHSGAVVIPAALAVAEAEGIDDGKRLLEAVIAGYDVALRVLEGRRRVPRPQHHRRLAFDRHLRQFWRRRGGGEDARARPREDRLGARLGRQLHRRASGRSSPTAP